MLALKTKEKVLFLCKQNSIRSQIAEALLKSIHGEYYDVYSAGSNPTNVNPQAIIVMSEIGIDISANRSKSLKIFETFRFDHVVTLCEDGQTCPLFMGGKIYLHKSIKDPSKVEGTDHDRVVAFRRTRDEIREWIGKTFKM